MKTFFALAAVMLTAVLLTAGSGGSKPSASLCPGDGGGCTNKLSLTACPGCTNKLSLDLAACPGCTNKLVLDLASCPGCTNKLAVELAGCPGCTNKFSPAFVSCTNNLLVTANFFNSLGDRVF